MSFIYDGVTVDPKTDFEPLEEGVLASEAMGATDWGVLRQALYDTRDAIIAGPWHGYTPLTGAAITALSLPGAYWVGVRDSDKHYVYWDGSTLTDLSAGGGGGGGGGHQLQNAGGGPIAQEPILEVDGTLLNVSPGSGKSILAAPGVVPKTTTLSNADGEITIGGSASADLSTSRVVAITSTLKPKTIVGTGATPLTVKRTEGAGALGFVDFVRDATSKATIGLTAADLLKLTAAAGFDLDAPSWTVGKQDTAWTMTVRPHSSGQGLTCSISGMPGATGQRGGDMIYAAGDSGGSSTFGGDCYIQGGAPGATGKAGDVIIRIHPDGLPLDAGVDVAFSANCGAILFGHPPVSESDQSGTIQFLGYITNSITFHHANSTGSVKSAQRGAGLGATGQSLIYTAGRGSNAGGGNAGAAAGETRLWGADGGDGAAGLAPGVAGNVSIKAGAPGTRVDTGNVNGGTVSVEVGAGVGSGTAGAINLGATGAAPVLIAVGQAGVRLQPKGNWDPHWAFSNITADLSTAWSSLTPSPFLAISKNFANLRALTLPDPTAQGLQAGQFRAFLIQTDGSCSLTNIQYIYPPGGAVTVNGRTISATGLALTQPWSTKMIFTDGANYFAEERGEFQGADANNNILDVLSVRHAKTTGAGAAGLGVGVAFQADNASNTWKQLAQIAAVYSVATAGSEKSYLRLQAFNGSGALADGCYVWGTGKVGIGTGTTEPAASLEVNGSVKLGASSASLLAFYGGTPAAQGGAVGATLTNNVASGGTDNTVDNWTDLSTYATDAAAIRNAIYQLARKLRLLELGIKAPSLVVS
jgi:hypothetical protein